MKTLLTLSLIFLTLAGYSQITFEKDYYGNTVAKDEYGQVIYTLEENYYGEVEKKNSYGEVVGTYKKDGYGNTVYYPAETTNSSSGMYKVQPAQIETGVGKGGAQVLPSTAVDLSSVGYAMGRRAAEKRRKNKFDIEEYVRENAYKVKVNSGEYYKIPSDEYWMVKTVELYYKTAAVLFISDTSLSAKEDKKGGLYTAIEEDIIFGGVGKENGRVETKYLPLKTNYVFFTKPITVYVVRKD